MLKNFIKKRLGETNIRIIKSLFKSKSEKELMKKRKSFYLQLLKPGELYFDIGANYGNRIEPIVNDDIIIVAVEPQLKCVKYLKRKFNSKITVLPYGIGENKGFKTMYISNAHTLSSFSMDWIKSTKESGRFSEYRWDDKQEVEIETLDNLIAKYGLPQFIKIDVEGFELEVLKGLSHPIRTISFEYTIPEGKNSIINCIDRLSVIVREEGLLFNYSKEESMEWALGDWLTKKEFKKEIELERFIDSGFGDIYAKTEAV